MIDSQGSVAVLVLGAGVAICGTILYGCYVIFDRLQTRAETMRGYRRWTAIGLAAGVGLVALLVFWFCAERRTDAGARIESLSPGAQRLEPLFCGWFGGRGRRFCMAESHAQEYLSVLQARPANALYPGRWTNAVGSQERRFLTRSGVGSSEQPIGERIGECLGYFTLCAQIAAMLAALPASGRVDSVLVWGGVRCGVWIVLRRSPAQDVGAAPNDNATVRQME